MIEKLTLKVAEKKLTELSDGWIIQNGHLKARFKFTDFKTALKFTNNVGRIAEKLDHHPKILLTWGKVVIEIWTHEANGLTEKDFEFALEIDKL